jgi:hypothetical protein
MSSDVAGYGWSTLGAQVALALVPTLLLLAACAALVRLVVRGRQPTSIGSTFQRAVVVAAPACGIVGLAILQYAATSQTGFQGQGLAGHGLWSPWAPSMLIIHALMLGLQEVRAGLVQVADVGNCPGLAEHCHQGSCVLLGAGMTQ